MGRSKGSKPSRDKVRAHRARLRRQGLRLIQIWVPDVRSPAFTAEAHRQSLAVARSLRGTEDQGFVDAVSMVPQVVPTRALLAGAGRRSRRVTR